VVGRTVTGVWGAPASRPGQPASAPADWLSAVGDRVRLLRVYRGLNRHALARKAGVDRKSVRRVEAGRSGPYLSTLWRMADGLDVYMADLVAEPGNSRLDRHLAGRPSGAGAVRERCGWPGGKEDPA